MSLEPASLVLTAVVALVYVAIVVVAFALVIRVARWLFGPRRRPESDLGIQVLEERLRRGEISYAEYEVARRALGR